VAKPGRPALDPSAQYPSAGVHVKLTARKYDLADRHARERRESLPAVLRRALDKLLKDERGG
jgi:hypothetical protein